MVTVNKGASQKLVLTETFTTETDLSDKQFFAVKLDSDRRVVISNGAANLSVGVLQNDPKGTSALPQDAEVLVIGRGKMVAGGDLAAGGRITVDSSGRAVAAVQDHFIIGQVLEAAGTITAGQIVEVLVNFVNPPKME